MNEREQCWPAKEWPTKFAGHHGSAAIRVEATNLLLAKSARGIHHAFPSSEPFEPNTGKTRDKSA